MRGKLPIGTLWDTRCPEGVNSKRWLVPIEIKIIIWDEGVKQMYNVYYSPCSFIPYQCRPSNDNYKYDIGPYYIPTTPLRPRIRATSCIVWMRLWCIIKILDLPMCTFTQATHGAKYCQQPGSVLTQKRRNQEFIGTWFNISLLIALQLTRTCITESFGMLDL